MKSEKYDIFCRRILNKKIAKARNQVAEFDE